MLWDMSDHKPLRDERGRLLPGQTANAKGRPRSGLALAEMIREHQDPLEMIRVAQSWMRGEPMIKDVDYLRRRAEARARGEADPPIEGVEVQWPSDALRNAAINWLADHGWQKPVQVTELTVGQGPGSVMDMTRLSQEDLDLLEALQAKAAGVATPTQVAGALDVKTSR